MRRSWLAPGRRRAMCCHAPRPGRRISPDRRGDHGGTWVSFRPCRCASPHSRRLWCSRRNSSASAEQLRRPAPSRRTAICDRENKPICPTHRFSRATGPPLLFDHPHRSGSTRRSAKRSNNSTRVKADHAIPGVWAARIPCRQGGSAHIATSRYAAAVATGEGPQMRRIFAAPAAVAILATGCSAPSQPPPVAAGSASAAPAQSPVVDV